MSGERVRSAIFPVAGLGTRFLPATKSVPKELLPVLDTPLIQFAVDEAVAAGVERLIFVSHPSKAAIERYMTPDKVLSDKLRQRGKLELADRVSCTSAEGVEIVFTHQLEPLGLGHAVLCARDEALPGPVAVLLPDDLIVGKTGCLSQMVAAYQTSDIGHLIATVSVPREKVSSYGILSVTGIEGPLAHADGMVEKPAPDQAPSTTAVVGRYVLDGSIFDDLERTQPGAGGEIQLTDAIAAGVTRVGLAGFEFEGDRFDCGSPEGMLAATLYRAHATPSLADVVRAAANGNHRFAAE